MGVNPYDGLYVYGWSRYRGKDLYTLHKNVDTLTESHDLPRTGSAKWRIWSATPVMFPKSRSQMSCLHDGSSFLLFQVFTTA